MFSKDPSGNSNRLQKFWIWGQRLRRGLCQMDLCLSLVYWLLVTKSTQKECPPHDPLSPPPHHGQGCQLPSTSLVTVPSPFPPDKCSLGPKYQQCYYGKSVIYCLKWKYVASIFPWEAPDDLSSKWVQAEKSWICLWALNLYQGKSMATVGPLRHQSNQQPQQSLVSMIHCAKNKF